MTPLEFWTVLGALIAAWGSSFLYAYHTPQLGRRQFFEVLATVACVLIFVFATFSPMIVKV